MSSEAETTAMFREHASTASIAFVRTEALSQHTVAVGFSTFVYDGDTCTWTNTQETWTDTIVTPTQRARSAQIKTEADAKSQASQHPTSNHQPINHARLVQFFMVSETRRADRDTTQTLGELPLSMADGSFMKTTREEDEALTVPDCSSSTLSLVMPVQIRRFPRQPTTSEMLKKASKQRVEHVRPWIGDDVTQELRLVHRRFVLTL